MSENEREHPELRTALRALSAAERNREAPAAVESNLLAAFRAQSRSAGAVCRGPRRWWWAVAAAAVLLMAALADRKQSAPQVAGRPVAAPVAGKVAAGLVPDAAGPAPDAVAAAPAPRVRVARVRRKVRPRAPAVRTPPPEPARDEGEFIPLPYTARLAPGEELDVVRVRLPRATLMQFGLPVTAERAWEPVNADLVVGQDGITRAIRFVR